VTLAMLSGYFWLAAGGALIGSFQMGFQLAIMNCSMAAVAQSLQRPEATAGALIVRAELQALEKERCHPDRREPTCSLRRSPLYFWAHALERYLLDGVQMHLVRGRCFW